MPYRTDAQIARTPVGGIAIVPRWNWRALLLPAVLALAVPFALPIDLRVSQWCVQDKCPGEINTILRLTETFGHAYGAVILLIAVYMLDPTRRWALVRLALCAFLSGLAADGLKLLVLRTRPHHFDFLGDVWTSFGTWLPMTSAGASGQSFPSAHTAMAVGLAAGLSWLYPRGRLLFIALAILLGCQRIESGSHFPSDVLGGAALGSLISVCLLQFGYLPSVCDWVEYRWLRRPAV